MEGSYITSFLQNKWFRIFLVIDIIIVIALLITFGINNTKTATLNLNVTPLDAKIALNNTGEYGSGTYNVHPGNYTITISREGLDTKTFNLDISNGENAAITTYLTKDGNIDFYRSKEQRGSFNKLSEMIHDGNNNTTDQDTSAENAILALNSSIIDMQSLPINDVLYENTDSGRHLVHDITIRESHSDDCQTWLCLEALVLGTEDQSVVTDILNTKRFNVEDYEIVYKIY